MSKQNPKYLIGIMTCSKYLHKAEEQYKKYFTNIHDYENIVYVKFIGDPTIEGDYIYQKENNLLILKCKDDYLNLPNKVYCFYKTICALFPDITNVVKMDDDVIVDLPKLYSLITLCKDIPYAGRYVCVGSTLSTWLYQKTDVCSEYPELGLIPVYMYPQEYCAGCIYLLTKTSIDIIVKYPELFPPFPNNYSEYIKHLNGETKAFINLHVFEDYNVGMVLTKLNNVPITQIREELRVAATWDGIDG
jgi:hypothetical protein